jgi:hypothetical protein
MTTGHSQVAPSIAPEERWLTTIAALAGGDSIHARICGSDALRVGFLMDRPRHARAHRSAASIGRSGFLSLRP